MTSEPRLSWEPRIEACEIEVKAGAIGEAVDGGHHAIVQPQGVETQQTRGQRLAATAEGGRRDRPARRARPWPPSAGRAGRRVPRASWAGSPRWRNSNRPPDSRPGADRRPVAQSGPPACRPRPSPRQRSTGQGSRGWIGASNPVAALPSAKCRPVALEIGPVEPLPLCCEVGQHRRPSADSSSGSR